MWYRQLCHSLVRSVFIAANCIGNFKNSNIETFLALHTSKQKTFWQKSLQFFCSSSFCSCTNYFVILNHWVPTIEFCYLQCQGCEQIYHSHKPLSYLQQ